MDPPDGSEFSQAPRGKGGGPSHGRTKEEATAHKMIQQQKKRKHDKEQEAARIAEASVLCVVPNDSCANTRVKFDPTAVPWIPCVRVVRDSPLTGLSEGQTTHSRHQS